MRKFIALIPAALLLFAAGDALAQHRPPPHGGRDPIHVDRDPIHVDRGPVHVDRGPIHVDRGPIHVVAPTVRWVSPAPTVIIDPWSNIDSAWSEVAWLRDRAAVLERDARYADARQAERYVDDAEDALDEAESILAWRGRRSVYDAQIAQAMSSLSAAEFELAAMADDAAAARAWAVRLVDRAEDAACDARLSRCTSVVDDAEDLVAIGRSDENSGRYGDAIEHYEEAAEIAAEILERIDDRYDRDDWDDHRHDNGNHYGHDRDDWDDDRQDNGNHHGHDRDDDDWDGYYPGRGNNRRES